MCYLVQQQPEAERGGTAPQRSNDRLRPRLAGAIAAALIGGWAVAAFVPATPQAAKDVVPAPPLRTAATPGGAVGQPSVPLDDEVPTWSGAAKAGIGHCQHGL